jgi:hypothetical protein
LLILATALVLYVVAMAVPSPSANSLPSAAGTAVKSGRDAALARVADALVEGNVNVEVWCWSPADWREKTTRLNSLDRARGHGGPSRYGAWSAYATPSRNQIHLSPEVCAELRRLAAEPVPLAEAKWPDALAWAVFVLAHEAFHAMGVHDEADAECLGMQSITVTARLLGRSEAEGRSLTLRYLERWRSTLPAAYRSPECRNNGLLDLDLDRAAWP